MNLPRGPEGGNTVFTAGGTSRPKMGEIKAYDSSKERKDIEELGTLYTIIRVTEALEAAYNRDAIQREQYAEECTKLISHFKSTESALIAAGHIANAADFMAVHQIDCPRAADRLIKYGVPATVLHASHTTQGEGGNAYLSSQATQSFITLMDSIRLEQRAVDDIKPLMVTLCSSLGKVTTLPPNFEGSVKMSLWLQKLHQMRAVDEISDADARQLLMELDSSYAAFVEVLQGGGPR